MIGNRVLKLSTKYFRRPEELLKVGLLVLMLTLPLANRDLFSIFHPKLHPARILLPLLLLLTTAFLGRRLLRKQIRWATLKDSLADPISGLLLILLAVRGLSLINSLNLTASLSLLAFFTVMVGFWFLLGYVGGRNANFLFTLYKVYAAVVGVVAVFALVQVLLVVVGVRLPGVLVGGAFIRIPGTFYDANHLAPYLITALPFFLSQSFLAPPGRRQWSFFALATVAILGVFLSFSRSGILGFGVMSLVFCLFLAKFGRWRKLGLIFGIFAFLGVLVLLSSRTELSLVKRALSVLNPAERSTTAHSLLLSGELVLFAKNPILGVGYGSFSEHFRQSPVGQSHSVIDPATHVRLPTHSIWFEVLAETGLLGFVPYTILMGLILHRLFQALAECRNLRFQLYFGGFIASLAGILSSGVFYSYNLEFFWFFLFFAAIFSKLVIGGEFSAATKYSRTRVEKIPWRELGTVGLIGGLAVLMLFGKLGRYTLSADEGLWALLSKSVLRYWEVRWENWWVPHWRGEVWLKGSPLYFWLSALSMFFYQINSVTPRFGSALFGVFTVLFLYFQIRKRFGRPAAVLGSLICLANPWFLAATQTASPVSGAIFLGTVSIFLFFKARRHSRFWPLLGLVHGVLLLWDSPTALWLGILFLLVALWEVLYLRRRVFYRTWWLSGFPLFLALVGLPWYRLMYHRFGADFLLENELFQFVSHPRLDISLLVFLPAAIFLGLRFLPKVRYRRLLIGGVVVLCLCNWAAFRRRDSLRHEIYLAQRRQEISRTGTHPNLILSDYDPVLAYYSDVPFVWLDSREKLEEVLFQEEKRYFALLPVDEYQPLRGKLGRREMGSRVVIASEDLLLIEKW